ncbi:hypothetical protein R3P38DRAFT_2981670 [Favolaschia claudopus]|uniref:F-box domain-containing protein n=1 Tax=Favolaschia claudopus TaxID=2862362 RepID=A0AAW0AYG5_9AGAR
MNFIKGTITRALLRSRTAMSTPESQSPFHIQELCDQIALSVPASPAPSSDLQIRTLRTLSLVSPAFKSAAQRILFCDIDVKSLTLRGKREEVQAWNRFLLIVTTHSPHLLTYIKRLDLPFRDDVLSKLRSLHFPNVQALVFRGPDLFRETDVALEVMSEMMRLPSVRSASFLNLTCPVPRFLRLFEHCSAALSSVTLENIPAIERPVHVPARRVELKQFQFSNMPVQLCPEWLFNRTCPFDFSHVQVVAFPWNSRGGNIVPVLAGILDRVRGSVRRLALLDPRYITPPISLANMPKLQHLELDIIGDHLLSVLLPALSAAGGRLKLLRLSVRYDDKPSDIRALERLGAAMTLDVLPVLQYFYLIMPGVQINTVKGIDGLEGVRRERIERAFAVWKNAGNFKLVDYYSWINQ